MPSVKIGAHEHSEIIHKNETEKEKYNASDKKFAKRERARKEESSWKEKYSR